MATVNLVAAMLFIVSQDEIQRLINSAIRDHEIRVAVVSGVMGALLLVGTWHAIWLLRQLSPAAQ